MFLVGPEVSRIFAEIILQRVDLDLERRAASRGLVSEKDYVIRRYVDDFHLFAKSVDTLNILEDLLADGLEEYKLFLNVEKREDLQRPFVTRISRVKHEVGEVCEALERALGQDIEIDQGERIVTAGAQKSGRKALDALRFLGGSERQAFVSSFADVFSAIDRIVKRLGKLALDNEYKDLALEELFGRIKLTVRIIFYLISVDFRVPPLIRSAFLLRQIVSLANRFPSSERLALKAHIAYELSQLLAGNYDSGNASLPLEIANTFLIGLMVDPVSFCEQESTQSVLDGILGGRHVGYFSVICALHYLNSVSPNDLQHCDKVKENERREAFCRRVCKFLTSSECDPKVNAEDYLIFCDFLSCKSVDQTMRWETFSKKLGGTPLSKSSFEELMLRLRHTNWQEPGNEFELLIRRLQPVYFAS